MSNTISYIVLGAVVITCARMLVLIIKHERGLRRKVAGAPQRLETVDEALSHVTWRWPVNEQASRGACVGADPRVHSSES